MDANLEDFLLVAGVVGVGSGRAAASCFFVSPQVPKLWSAKREVDNLGRLGDFSA